MDDNNKESTSGDIEEAGKKADAADAERNDFVENVEKASFAKQQDKQDEQLTEKLKETTHDEEEKPKLDKTTKSLKDYNERDGCSPSSHRNDASKSSKQHTDKHRRTKDDTPTTSSSSSTGERNRRERRPTDYHRTSKHDTRKLSPSPSHYKSSPSEHRDSSRHGHHSRHDTHEHSSSHHRHSHGHHSQRTDKYHHKQKHSTSSRTSEHKSHNSKHSSPDGNVEETVKTNIDKTQHNVNKSPKTESSSSTTVEVVEKMEFVEQAVNEASSESLGVKSADTIDIINKSPSTTDKSSEDLNVIEISTTSTSDTADAEQQDVTNDEDKTIADSDKEQTDNDVKNTTVLEINTEQVNALSDEPMCSPKTKVSIVDGNDIVAPISNASPIISNDQSSNEGKPNETSKRPRQLSHEEDNNESTKNKRRRESDSIKDVTSDEIDVPIVATNDEANVSFPDKSMDDTCELTQSEDKDNNISDENSKALLSISEETSSSSDSTVVEVKPANESTEEDFVDLMADDSAEEHESNEQHDEDTVNEQSEDYSEQDIYLLGYNETGNPHIFYSENDPLRLRKKESSVEVKSPPSSPIEFMPLPSDEPDVDNANNAVQIVQQEKELALEEETTTTKSISSGMSPNLDSVSQKEGSTSPESSTALAVDLTIDETVVEGVEQIVELPQTIESNRIEAEEDIVIEQQQQSALNKNAEVEKFEENMMITEATATAQTNQIVNEANTNSTADSSQLDNQEVAAAGQNDSVLDAMPTFSELQNEEQLRELGKNYVFAVVKGKLIGLPRLTRIEIWECLQNAGFKSNGIVTEDEEAIDMIEEDPKLLYKLMSKKDVEALKQTAETVDEANTEKRSDEHYSIIEKLQQLKQQDDAEDEEQTNEAENQTNEVENIVGIATMQQQKELETDEVQQIEDYSFQQNETTVNDSNNDIGIADENEYNFEHLATNGKAPITLRLSPATLNQLKQYPTYFKTLRKHNHVIEEVPTEIETSTTTTATTGGNESTKRSKRKRRHSGKHGKHHRRSKRSRHSTHENDISAQTMPHIVGEDNNDSDDIAMEDSTNNINENDNENLNATTLNTNESLFVTPSTSKSAQNVAAAMPATTSTKKATASKRRLSLSTQQSVKTKQTQLSAKDDFFKKPFQYGWKRELVWRSNLDSTSKADVYFIAPNGKKFRSRSDIAPLLEGDLTIEHFCFIREPQDVGAEYELVRNAKSANRTTITPPTSTSAGLNKDSPLLVTGKRIVKPKAPKGASPPPEGWTAVRALRSNNAALTQKLPYDNDRSFSYERHTSSAAMQQPAPIIAPVPAPVAAASIECKLPETTTTNGTHGNYIYTSQSQPESDQGFTRQKPKPWPACDVDCERGKGEQPPLKCKLCLKRFHYACVGLKESKGKYFMKYSHEDPQLVIQEGAAYYCVPCAERFGCTRSVTEIPETETNDANALYAHTHTQQIVVIGGKKYILNSRPPEPTEAHIQMPTEARADLKRLQKTIIFQHRGKVMPELANTPNDDDEHDGDDAVSIASTTKTITGQPAQRKDFMENLTIGYNLLVLIMQKLPLQDCLRAGLACHLWQAATNDRRVWQCVKINDLRITNWQHFFNILRRMGTRELSLSAMLNCDNDDDDNDDVWRIFMREIGNVQTLRKLEMPRCPARIIESIMQSNQQLNVLKAQTIVVDDCLTLNHIGEMSNLQKLYLSPMEITNLAGDFHGLRLKELTQLSLTNFNNLHEKKISRLSMLINLRTLELGDCSLIDAQRLADVLLSMVNLRRLRIELGAVPKSEFCVLELLKVLQYLEHLKRLELINFDVKLGFDKALSKCKHLRKLLLIPTYILQSATTNNIIMNGVHSLATTLQNFTWVFTIELLRVTALYVNGDRTDDSIPILRPVPGDPDDHAEINESNGGDGGGGDDADADDGNGDGVNEEQHVAIVTLKTVEEIMKNRMPTTNFKIVKIFYGNTLKQQLED